MGSTETEDKVWVHSGRVKPTEINRPTGLGMSGISERRKDLEDRWLNLPGNLSPTVDGVLKDVGEDCLRTVVRWYIDC